MELRDILKEIEEYSQEGNRKGMTAALRLIMNNRRLFYGQSVEGALQKEFSDALYKILLLELDEEEEESIETAELAYLGLGCLSDEASVDPEHYKRRLLLLHYFCDYFTDSIIEVLLARFREDNILQARNLAIECLEKMQLSDMFYLEENEPAFIEKDEQIADACNTIVTDPDLSDQERKDAALLHKVLYAYLKAKYKEASLM